MMAPSATLTAKRRNFFFAVTAIAVVVVFIIRLIDIQIVRAESLVTEAHTKVTGSSRVFAHRGSIVDANGEPLAESIAEFTLTTAPKNVADAQVRNSDGTYTTISINEQLDRVSDIVDVPRNELRSIIDDELVDDPQSNYAVLATGLDAEQRLALSDLEISWLSYEQHDKRVYPNGAVAGNIVGFRSGDNEESLAGMELYADDCLSGADGLTRYQSSRDGVPLPGSSNIEQPVVEGGTLNLTIDKDLNWYLQQLAASQVRETRAEYANIVVTEAKTGKVRAVAESTSVDPNNFTDTEERYQGSLAFRDTYEPGSVGKALFAAALVDAGVADHDSQVVADDWYYADNGARIKDAVPHGPLNLTLTGVLQQSSNTGLSQLGERMPTGDIHEYLTKFGFGAATNIGFPGEQSGILRPVDEWLGQSVYTPMFGQGYSTTAMQIASSFQALANDGVRLPLQLVEGCTLGDGTESMVPDDADGERVVSADAAKETRKMMETVVTDGFLSDALEVPGYRVAAKSGTGEQFDAQGELKSTYFASMAGMFPADDPEYVVTVNIKDPRTQLTSRAAAPVFKQAVNQLIKHYGIPPSTTPGSDYPGYWK